MPITIYNSKSKKKEVFDPLVPGKVSMYVCGVTVYDDCHLAHLRCYPALFGIFWISGDVREKLHRHRRQNFTTG
jgi:cysteinyl-tRNA synthetase